MYQLIRNKIKHLEFENGGMRTLNNYVKILAEQLAVLQHTRLYSVSEYAYISDNLQSYLALQERYDSENYFNESKVMLLESLESLIIELVNNREIIKDSEYTPTYHDHLKLMLAMYEIEHIGYFQEQPIKKDIYYKHGRLHDHYLIDGDNVIIFDHSDLLPIMKKDILSRIEYTKANYSTSIH